MIKLTASTVIRNGSLTLKLNGEAIESGRVFERVISGDRDYLLEWSIEGGKDLHYSISISSSKGHEIYFKGGCSDKNSYFSSQGSFLIR